MEYLVVTNRRDLTSDYIVREFKRRGLRHYRLNTETISSYAVSFDPAGDKLELQQASIRIAVDEVRAAYFRRPEPPLLLHPQFSHPPEREYCRTEWSSLLKSIYLLLDGRWFSHPSAILLAEDKPRQLRLARRLGFRVPETLISNRLDAVQRLASSGPVVGKPLRHALIEDGADEKVIFTSRIPGFTSADEAAIRAAPVIFQREIPKRLDVRATVVAHRVFAVGIHSQSSTETSVDWRRGSDPRLMHEVIELPKDVEQACARLVREQGLRFGAIDLVLDTSDRFWFLECNPNGQWAWIENRTGLPITAAIVDELESIAQQ